MIAPGALSITARHPEIYANLSGPQMTKVSTWIGIFRAIMNADDPFAEMRSQAQPRSHLRGFSYKTMERYYYQLLGGADWTIFAPKHKVDPTRGLPKAFVSEWHERVTANKRKIEPAHRELIRDWREGKPVVGYGTWQEWWRKTKKRDVPADPAFVPPEPEGWSIGNLRKPKYAPDKGTIALARKGKSAFADHRPTVLKTREGLEVGRIIMFDDVWHDHNVLINGQYVRPLELGALDVASACKFAWGMRPFQTDEATGKRSGIKEREMRFLLADVLCNHGFHPEGVLLIVERGTAAVREELAEWLSDISDKLIRVESGGVQNEGFADQFSRQAKGNPRLKAALESFHNLTHNEAGALPGQVGKNYIEKPEQLYGQEHYTKALMQAAGQLSMEDQAKLLAPFMSFDEFMMVAGKMYDAINWRTNHNLEGWSGNMAPLWRLSEGDAWKHRDEFLQLDPEQRQLAEMILAKRPDLAKIEKMAPQAVYNRGQANLTRLPGWCAPRIIGEENGREVRVEKNRTIVLRDQLLGTHPIVYSARIVREDGTVGWLTARERYIAYVNPFNLQELYIQDAKGRYIGACKEWERVPYLDDEEMGKQMHRAEKAEKELMAPYLKAARKETREKKKLHDNNAKVFAVSSGEAPPEEIDEAGFRDVIEHFAGGETKPETDWR